MSPRIGRGIDGERGTAQSIGAMEMERRIGIQIDRRGKAGRGSVADDKAVLAGIAAKELVDCKTAVDWCCGTQNGKGEQSCKRRHAARGYETTVILFGKRDCWLTLTRFSS